MSLPGGLREPVRAALEAVGDRSAVRGLRPLGGGCINNAQRLETEKGAYLLKWNSDALPGMFAAEAKGLELLRQTGTVRVPEVYFAAERTGSAPAFILTEYLEGDGRRGEGQEMLGRKLALLHRSPAPERYGLDEDNYLGSAKQLNGWDADWVRFFGEKRLGYQMEVAARHGRLHGERGKRLEKLISALPGLLGGVERRPSLLHGDLWGGNVIPGPGELALIDPAAYYGDREAEIAYTELFGGFSMGFYRAYHETWPLESGYAERRDLYNLYHLLNHLNIFGEGYGGQVDGVLRRYT